MNSGSQKALRAKLASHRGHYGIDGGRGAVPVLFSLGGAGLLLLGLSLSPGIAKPLFQRVLECLAGSALLQMPVSFFYSTLRGKFAVWAELLAGLSLSGDERVLEMGCGRGAILGMLGKLLPRGQAVGVDLWRTEDQSGNSLESARANLVAEGVADRCELHTGDMRALPFPDASFDLVVSNLAVHNTPEKDGRRQAIDEAIRVLKPGGGLRIADLFRTEEYVEWLREAGMLGVRIQPLGWRFWFGMLGATARLVSAEKPAGGKLPPESTPPGEAP